MFQLFSLLVFGRFSKIEKVRNRKMIDAHFVNFLEVREDIPLVYTGFRGWRGGGSGRNGGGVLFYIEEIKKFDFFKLENVQKVLENQWKFYNFYKIFKFPYKSLNGKLIFTRFLSHLPGLLSFYIHLWNTKNFGVGLGVVPPGLGRTFGFWGVGCCINPCIHPPETPPSVTRNCLLNSPDSLPESIGSKILNAENFPSSMTDIDRDISHIIILKWITFPLHSQNLQ